MGFFTRAFAVGTTIVLALIAKQCYDMFKPLPLPNIDYLDQNWGPGDKNLYKDDTTIKPFKIVYPAETIEKLRTKLDDVPALAKPMEGISFEYGFNSNNLMDVLKYWRSSYLDKWSEREKYLNQFPHFKTKIQGLDIHFIHVKPQVPKKTKVIPLLLLHGWPGSVREFYDIIPMLTSTSDDKQFVFEVIVPSLPGYGWSQGPSKTGMGPAAMAVLMKNLMKRIGHEKFFVQGGDWGSAIADRLATFFQDDVYGVHMNMCAMQNALSFVKSTIASYAPSMFIDEKYIDFYSSFTDTFKYLIHETGYMHIQATKPDTIGTTLMGNPIGLAAYILEKFSTWTNPAYRSLPDGGLQKYFTLDSLLDNIMVYYLTDSITTSQRLYLEAFRAQEMGLAIDRMETKVPAACAKFKHELMQTIDWALRDHFVNLLQSNHYEDGGHFAAMQLPRLLYKDIVDFVSKVPLA
ncbi:juvenile hormone epoxide hydrolase 1-like [Toxorhynchites rutilus septentrionalis]|uniref:juvenile hormone epoxide hydrolase 1-like n=1 Tax=Toxorhynchites rutilus septentrionalis TaxID=329112 RepID=UPI002479B662|nr:juvenile hormone epoxide hydrolase 1-like [Toxorhynchites rutilus septentrionalis]